MRSYEFRIREQTRRDFHSLWSGWHKRRKRKPSVWATQTRRIAAGQSPLTKEIHDRCFLDWWRRRGGPLIGTGEDIAYSHILAPHAVEPMDDADDPDVNVIVLMMGRRLVKTEGICGNVIGRGMTDDPGNIMSDWPVESSSTKFSRDVINPMIDATPELGAVTVEKKSRDSGRTIDYIRFSGGSLYIINAGSKSKHRGPAAMIVIGHEVDAYPVDAQGEGDPIEKLFGRAEGFSAIKILEGTPTRAATVDENGKKIYHSNIEKWYDRSDQRKWFCPCRICNEGQWLKWEQIRELEKKSGEVWFYVCEKCDAAHNERQWRRLVSDGEWRATAPFVDGIRGYWINGFNSLLPRGRGFKSKLAQFAVEGRRALNGTPEEKRVWINEVETKTCAVENLGEPPPPWELIFKRREDYNDGKGSLIVPQRCLVINAGIDVQKDRIELGWIGTGRRNETWALDYTILPGNVDEDEVWKELDNELERPFQHESGATMLNAMAFIDTAKWPDRVWKFLRRKPRQTVRACRGSNIRPHPIVNAVWTHLASSKLRIATDEVAIKVKGHWIGGDAATDWIYGRLAKEAPAESAELPDGWHHFGKHCDENYFGQLTSERVFIKDNGERRYEHVGPCRNEILDIHKYALGAFRSRSERRWGFDSIEAGFKAYPAKDEQKIEAPKPQPPHAPVQRSRRAVVSSVEAW